MWKINLFYLLTGLMTVIGILPAAGQGSYASKYIVNNLDLSSGLPHNNVNSLFADSQGFIWIATYGGGAVRYDGYSFASPLALTGSQQLASNSCKGFAEDLHHRLWIAYDEGTEVIDLKTMRSVVPAGKEGNIARLLRKKAVKVYCDSKGCVWHATNDSIFRYTFDKQGNVEHITSCQYLGNMPDVNICDIEHNGTVWCNIDNGLFRLVETGGNLARWEIAPSIKQLYGYFVTALLKRGTTVWIATNHGLFAYDQNSKQLRTYQHTADMYSLSHDYATSLAVSSTGNLLVGTLHGLDIMNNDNETFEHWNSGNDEHPIPSDFIHCLLVHAGQLWIGTETAGIIKLAPHPLLLHNYTHNRHQPSSLSPYPVNAICVDTKGTLWVGTVEGGLNRRNADGTFDHWTTQNSALSHNSVSVLENDPQGNIWIGTWGGGLNVMTGGSQPILRHIAMEGRQEEKTNHIGALAYDYRNNALWIGSNDGIFLYNLQTGKLESPFPDNEEARGCIGAHIDHNGQLWMGCITGVCVIDLKGGRNKQGVFSHRRLRNKLNQPQSPVIDKISCFCETQDGTLWLGSNGYGLYRRHIDEKTGKETFQVLTTDNGLANNCVKGIVEDYQGRLWITTDNGLSVYDPRAQTFINYGKHNGLISDRFYWNSAVKGHDGTIYLGTICGLVEIKGENVETTQASHLVFTRLEVNNQVVTASNSSILDVDISCANRIRLHESDRSFSLYMSSLTFQRREGYYSYRLKDFEEEWNNLRPDENAIRYTRLKPGNYTLEVRFITDNNKEMSQQLSIRIDVTPYFWKSWWFILVLVLVIAGITVWLYRVRLESWRKKETEKLLIPIRDVLNESDNPLQLQSRIKSILDNQLRIKQSQHRSLEADRKQMERNKAFMERAMNILEQHYTDSSFGITEFAEAIGMSKSLLSKRLNAEIGQSTGQFIRNYRLSMAKKIILEHPANRNITEIAYQVGFNDPKYFTRCFTRLYGSTPSTYKEVDEKP